MTIFTQNIHFFSAWDKSRDTTVNWSYIEVQNTCRPNLVMKKLTLVRILTVFIVTSAVILSYSSTVQGTPLFFDFLKRTFGGKGKAPKPANQRPQGSAWATGGQYQKEKKFPWDIFGIFGYKNVIRPNNRPRPQRPGPPYRPPRFLVLHVKTYHIQTLCSKWEIYYFILFCHSNCFFHSILLLWA